MMWSDLSFGVLAYIFSFLSPDSLACTKSVCRNWHEAAKYLISSEINNNNRPAWFLAYPIRNPDNFWYAYTPVDRNWYTLPLDFIPNRSIDSVRSPIRPISTVGGLIILKLTTTAALQLAVCNPFTRLFKLLPELNIRRKNPAVGVECKSSAADAKFKIYVAGGMSDTATGGATYEPTVEMYDSSSDKWEIIGDMQMEIAVRLTVWTPNESVCSNGVLYWMTSARVYSVMGFDIGTKEWRELSVPMGGERMEFGALVPRKGKLCFVGGKCGGDGCIWEMGEEEGKWRMVERVPHELGMRFLRGKGCWDGTKCVGIEGVMCLYRNLGEGSGMLIWKEEEDKEKKKKYEWKWIDECCSIRGKQLQNLQIKGLLLHPNLAHTSR